MVTKLDRNFAACERNLGDYLERSGKLLERRTMKQVAQKIADEYHKAVRTAIPKRVPGFSALTSTFIGLNPKPIQMGFMAVFEKFSKRTSDRIPPPIEWMPAAAGIVTYWTGKQLLLTSPPPLTPWLDVPPEFGSPPPPPAAPIPIHTPPMITNMVTVPGTPTPLNVEIHTAFNKKKPRLVARFAVKAFKNHAKLISGIAMWSNPVPPVAPPVPTPFPWVGIQ